MTITSASHLRSSLYSLQNWKIKTEVVVVILRRRVDHVAKVLRINLRHLKSCGLHTKAKRNVALIETLGRKKFFREVWL